MIISLVAIYTFSPPGILLCSNTLDEKRGFQCLPPYQEASLAISQSPNHQITASQQSAVLKTQQSEGIKLRDYLGTAPGENGVDQNVERH